MKLSHELGKIFEASIEKVLQREKEDSNFLPQSQFANSITPCTDRSKAIIEAASEDVINTLGLGICTHRESDEHGEFHEDEKICLVADMTPELIEIGERSFWNG